VESHNDVLMLDGNAVEFESDIYFGDQRFYFTRAMLDNDCFIKAQVLDPTEVKPIHIISLVCINDLDTKRYFLHKEAILSIDQEQLIAIDVANLFSKQPLYKIVGTLETRLSVVSDSLNEVRNQMLRNRFINENKGKLSFLKQEYKKFQQENSTK